MSEQKNKHLTCTLCKSGEKDSPHLDFVLISPEQDLYLCSECACRAHNACSQNFSTVNTEQKESGQKLNPIDFYNELNKYVIGQDEAKKKISVAIAQHQRRLMNPDIKKSNILLIGPTGTGKTEIARTVSQFLKIPFVITDATNLTTRGYVGEDVESILGRLLSSVDYNVSLAEKGIVFIDEIDKLARSNNGDSGVNTVSVQQELLKMIEGSIIKLKLKTPIGTEEFFINTSNILFICSGAFEGMSKMNEEKVIGMNSVHKKELSTSTNVDNQDLVKYGLIPEFIGRFSILVKTELLSKEDLIKILVEPVNSIIRQKEKLFKLDDITLEFSNGFLNSVAESAFNEKLGARGLNKIIEKTLGSLYFDLDKYKNKTIFISEHGIKIKNNNSNFLEEQKAS